MTSPRIIVAATHSLRLQYRESGLALPGEELGLGIQSASPLRAGPPSRSSTRSRTPTSPAYLLRDRDAIYGADFQRRVERMGIRQNVIAPRAPWQNPFAERLIGSIRANASISSSCSTNATCAACFARISPTTTPRGLTRVSATTAHAGARYSRSRPGVSVPEVGGLHYRYQRAA